MSAAKPGRRHGRGARKRTLKRLTANVVAVNGEVNHSGNQPPPELTAEEAAAKARCLFSDTQQAISEKYIRALRVESSQLSGKGAWEYLISHLNEARAWGLEEELRALCFDAAGAFADVRMLRLTAKHRPR